MSLAPAMLPCLRQLRPCVFASPFPPAAVSPQLGSLRKPARPVPEKEKERILFGNPVGHQWTGPSVGVGVGVRPGGRPQVWLLLLPPGRRVDRLSTGRGPGGGKDSNNNKTAPSVEALCQFAQIFAQKEDSLQDPIR